MKQNETCQLLRKITVLLSSTKPTTASLSLKIVVRRITRRLIIGHARLMQARCIAAVTLLTVSIASCSSPEPVTEDRYQGSDALFTVLDDNITTSAGLKKIVAIDHSRLGAEAGSVMPPARVLIFSDPKLEALLLKINPLIAIDLPLRVLAYESVTDGNSRVVFNTFDYLRSRYQLGDLPELQAMFEARMAEVVQDIKPEQVSAFVNDTMQPDGIVTLTSPFDFETTIERITDAVDAQDDTLWFGKLDFQAQAKEQGIDIGPARLLLFGAPGPGAKAMAEAPTMGLDAFCQKLLVWQDSVGTVKVSFNDLLALAERQDVSKNVALRVVNYRLKSTFVDALEQE